MATDDPLTHDELLADLVKANTAYVPEHYFTVMGFANKIGKGRSAAERVLRERVAAGELETKMALVKGHHTHIYWFTAVTG